MKSSIFKKALLISMASLTTLSTLSGSISTKIHAIEPRPIRSVGRVTMEPFASCSYGGYNIIIYCNKHDFKQKGKEECVEEFKKVMVPYDEKIPRWKEIPCVNVGFDGVMVEFLSIKKPEKRRKYIENRCLRPCIENYMSSIVTCSHAGHNFVVDFNKLGNNGLNIKLINQFGKKIKKLMDKYDEKLPENKVITDLFSSYDSFSNMMKRLSLTRNKKEQKEIIKFYLDEIIQIKPERYFVRCSYKGYNFKVYFFKTPKDESQKKMIDEFIKTFSMIMTPFDGKISEEKKISCSIRDIDRTMGEFFSKETPEEQKKYIEENMLDYVLERKPAIYLVKRTYKGHNIEYGWDIPYRNEEEKKIAQQFEEKFKEITNPCDEIKSKDEETATIISTVKFMRDFVSLKTPEERMKYIEDHFGIGSKESVKQA